MESFKSPLSFILIATIGLLATFVPPASAGEASVMICSTVFSGKCGIWASYTNYKTRQTVNYQSGGQTACAVAELRKHTNSAGFWVNFDITGSKKGANIGYNPTGRSINLSQLTPKSKTGQTQNDQNYLNGRCRNEFGWGDVDTSLSFENYYINLPDLY